jgi:hypothetical protein
MPGVTVHGHDRWPSCGSRSAPSQPVCAAGSASIQARIALLGGGVVEGDDAAHQRGWRPTTAMAQDRVVLADQLLGELVHAARGREARLAEQLVTAAVWYQREVPRSQVQRIGAVDAEPAPTGGDDVETQAVGEGGHLQRPGRGCLRAAVEGPGHSQQVQRLSLPGRARRR